MTPREVLWGVQRRRFISWGCIVFAMHVAFACAWAAVGGQWVSAALGTLAIAVCQIAIAASRCLLMTAGLSIASPPPIFRLAVVLAIHTAFGAAVGCCLWAACLSRSTSSPTAAVAAASFEGLAGLAAAAVALAAAAAFVEGPRRFLFIVPASASFVPSTGMSAGVRGGVVMVAVTSAAYLCVRLAGPSSAWLIAFREAEPLGLALFSFAVAFILQGTAEAAERLLARFLSQPLNFCELSAAAVAARKPPLQQGTPPISAQALVLEALSFGWETVILDAQADFNMESTRHNGDQSVWEDRALLPIVDMDPMEWRQELKLQRCTVGALAHRACQAAAARVGYVVVGGVPAGVAPPRVSLLRTSFPLWLRLRRPRRVAQVLEDAYGVPLWAQLSRCQALRELAEAAEPLPLTSLPSFAQPLPPSPSILQEVLHSGVAAAVLRRLCLVVDLVTLQLQADALVQRLDSEARAELHGDEPVDWLVRQVLVCGGLVQRAAKGQNLGGPYVPFSPATTGTRYSVQYAVTLPGLLAAGIDRICSALLPPAVPQLVVPPPAPARPPVLAPAALSAVEDAAKALAKILCFAPGRCPLSIESLLPVVLCSLCGLVSSLRLLGSRLKSQGLGAARGELQLRVSAPELWDVYAFAVEAAESIVTVYQEALSSYAFPPSYAVLISEFCTQTSGAAPR